jgi:hypothetical protein
VSTKSYPAVKKQESMFVLQITEVTTRLDGSSAMQFSELDVDPHASLTATSGLYGLFPDGIAVDYYRIYRPVCGHGNEKRKTSSPWSTSDAPTSQK